MDKTLRNALVACLVVIAIAVAYYFVYRPLKLENARKECAFINKKAPTEEEKQQAREIWENNRCEDNKSGLVPIQCTTSKEKMTATGDYKVKANEKQFEQCLREKGFAN